MGIGAVLVQNIIPIPPLFIKSESDQIELLELKEGENQGDIDQDKLTQKVTSPKLKYMQKDSKNEQEDVFFGINKWLYKKVEPTEYANIMKQ